MGVVIGLEGTAHTAGVGIVAGDGTVLANESEMYRPPEGGIHPRKAADHHAAVFGDLILRALTSAGVRTDDIEAVAFSIGPGLGPCLRVTATAARAAALTLGVPLIGVNHCVAHLEIGRIVGSRDPILLYVSGGNTQVLAFVDGRYRVLGETLDIGIGNLLDKLGLAMGLRFPAAPRLEELARQGRRYVPLPYSVKGMDVAFSGILTAAQGSDLGPADLALSVQETAFAMLVEVTERAMAHTGKGEVLLGGGVAQNARLVEMVSIMCRERGAVVEVPP
ncbi:MAG TPA: tRNA (adenosine(37)-N6)-threonylcarbamoyltransferase complex transferase subunit TsaD, partial [Thermoplasmata archaeon]|nr:tRNA (adenosine(37)-N6)-threonylcarbamoyltransferase complex transferase subunit TsaD [Thermoplasmata archaeon]